MIESDKKFLLDTKEEIFIKFIIPSLEKSIKTEMLI